MKNKKEANPYYALDDLESFGIGMHGMAPEIQEYHMRKTTEMIKAMQANNQNDDSGDIQSQKSEENADNKHLL